MSDLIKLTAPTAPFESFWVSASSVVLIEPVPYVYGNRAKARILLEGGDSRQCSEEPAEVDRLITEAHTHTVAASSGPWKPDEATKVRQACEWSDYRKEYGVSAEALREAHKAFLAGWSAAMGNSFEGGPLR